MVLAPNYGDTTWTGRGAADPALCPLAPALLGPSLLTVYTQPDPAAIFIVTVSSTAALQHGADCSD